MFIFGALDLYSFYRSFPGLIRMVTAYSASILNALLILLLGSLIVSGPLFMLDNKLGYVIYYFQFPLRLIFSVVTFGFIARIINTQPGTFAQGMLTATILALEAVRLMVTIQKNKVNI